MPAPLRRIDATALLRLLRFGLTEEASRIDFRVGCPPRFTVDAEAIPTPDEVLREAASTVLYYSEKLGGRGLSKAVVRSVALPPEEAGELLREPLGLTPETLRLPRCEAEIPSDLAAAAGCVLGRAA